MGKRGPPKTPAATHKARGTYRDDRHSGPSLSVEIPMAPADMKPRAKALWNVVTKELHHAGLIARLDQLTLRLMCESWCLYLDACEMIDAQGITISTDKGNMCQHPAVGTRNKAWAQVVAIAKQFGMTPSSRTGIVFEVSAKGSRENAIAKILKMNG